MSETDLTLSPIDLSTIPDLGHRAQSKLMKEVDGSITKIAVRGTSGVVLGIVSVAAGLVAVNAGSQSIIVAIGGCVLMGLSVIGLVIAAHLLTTNAVASRKFEAAIAELVGLDETQPLAPNEHQLRESAVAWNKALAAWQEARDATTLDDPLRHREEIVRGAERLLEEKRKLLEVTAQLRPYHKLLTRQG